MPLCTGAEVTAISSLPQVPSRLPILQLRPSARSMTLTKTQVPHQLRHAAHIGYCTEYMPMFLPDVPGPESRLPRLIFPPNGVHTYSTSLLVTHIRSFAIEACIAWIDQRSCREAGDRLRSDITRHVVSRFRPGDSDFLSACQTGLRYALCSRKCCPAVPDDESNLRHHCTRIACLIFRPA